MNKKHLIASGIALTLFACNSPKNPDTKAIEIETTKKDNMEFNDAHSFAKPKTAALIHLNWNVEVDFDKKIISGTATYDIKTAEGATEIILDTKNDLDILSVTADGKSAEFKVGEYVEHLGNPLSISITDQTKQIAITYKTNPNAAALQWLSPQQTANKTAPFLFTQSQAILGRSWIPVQDGEGGKNDFIRKDVRDKNPVKAMFMTLNRNLIEQQNKRIKQYYQGSINPLNWQTVDIETYLQDMCKIIGIKWKKLEYSKFEEAFHENRIKQRNNSLLNEVRKKSIPALWLEYQVNFIDLDGVKKETDSYRGGRSDLFTTDEKDHMEAFAKYCQSEFTKYLSIPEIAGVISNRILEIENSDSRRDKERILTMKSDILVLDEVQDLTSPMLSLLLLMHKGELGSIFMCGDDEQTLLFSPFDWKNTFQKINAFFHKKSQIYPSSWQLKRLLAPKWKSAASDDLNNLLVVERNVEPIVDFIADSWNTSISQLVRPDSEPTTGAGAVKAGKKAKNKGEVLDKTGQMYGVYQRKIDSTSLIQLCKDISGSTQDAAVVFPDEILRDYFYVELAKEGIDLPLYTTSDVKGLEYPMVLPISP